MATCTSNNPRLLRRARIRLAFARHDLDRMIGEPLRWWLVNRLPRCVVTWALLRAGVECTGHSGRPGEEVPTVPFTTVLHRWSRETDRHYPPRTAADSGAGT